MAKNPYLKFWVGDYLADTRHLSTLEHGAYLLLLMEAWRRPSCSLPDDDRLLAKLAGLTVEEWEPVKPVVMALWNRDGRRREWTQKRLLLERSKTIGKSATNRDAALSRWGKEKKGDANAMRTQCQNDAYHSHSHSQKNKGKESVDSEAPKKPPRKSILQQFPDYVTEESARGFVENRRALRKPLTDRAMVMLSNNLDAIREAGFDPSHALDIATEKGWQTVRLDYLRDQAKRFNGAGNGRAPMSAAERFREEQQRKRERAEAEAKQ